MDRKILLIVGLCLFLAFVEIGIGVDAKSISSLEADFEDDDSNTTENLLETSSILPVVGLAKLETDSEEELSEERKNPDGTPIFERWKHFRKYAEDPVLPRTDPTIIKTLTAENTSEAVSNEKEEGTQSVVTPSEGESFSSSVSITDDITEIPHSTENEGKTEATIPHIETDKALNGTVSIVADEEAQSKLTSFVHNLPGAMPDNFTEVTNATEKEGKIEATLPKNAAENTSNKSATLLLDKESGSELMSFAIDLPGAMSDNVTEVSNSTENEGKTEITVTPFEMEEASNESTRLPKETVSESEDVSLKTKAENGVPSSSLKSVDTSDLKISGATTDRPSTISSLENSETSFSRMTLLEEEQINDFVNETNNETDTESVPISPTKVLVNLETTPSSDSIIENEGEGENVTFPTEILESKNSEQSRRNSQAAKSLESPSDEEKISSGPTDSSELPVTHKEEHSEKGADSIKTLGSSEDFIWYKLKDLSINGSANGSGTNLYSSLLEGRDNSDSSDSTLQDVNSRQNLNFDANTPLLSSNIDNKSFTTSLFTFDNFPNYTHASHDITKSIISENSNFGLKPGVKIESTATVISNHQTLYQDSTEPADSDIFLNASECSLHKNYENGAHTIILPRNCSKDSTFFRVLQLLNRKSNSRLIDTNGACESTEKLNFTLNSQDLFNEVMELIKTEGITNEMVVINLHSNSTISFDLLSETEEDGFYVSKLLFGIVAGGTTMLVTFLICLVIYTTVKCRRSSTSLDLSDMPHLSVKHDYNLAPIPRPSISFPESNRDFLHAYSNDTYNRPRLDDTILNQHHFSGGIPQAYEMVAKDGSSKQEMHTFTGRRSANRKSDFKSSPSHEYASPDTWDHLKEKEPLKKYGMENPGFRKW